MKGFFRNALVTLLLIAGTASCGGEEQALDEPNVQTKVAEQSSGPFVVFVNGTGGWDSFRVNAKKNQAAKPKYR